MDKVNRFNETPRSGHGHRVEETHTVLGMRLAIPNIIVVLGSQRGSVTNARRSLDEIRQRRDEDVLLPEQRVEAEVVHDRVVDRHVVPALAPR